MNNRTSENRHGSESPREDRVVRKTPSMSSDEQSEKISRSDKEDEIVRVKVTDDEAISEYNSFF